MSMISSRWSRRALVAAISTAWVAAAQAEVPAQQQEQAPGWFRMMVGDVEVSRSSTRAEASCHPAVAHGRERHLLRGLEDVRVARGHRHGKCCNRPDNHHPLYTKIQDPRLFNYGLSYCGKDQWRRRRYDG